MTEPTVSGFAQQTVTGWKQFFNRDDVNRRIGYWEVMSNGTVRYHGPEAPPAREGIAALNDFDNPESAFGMPRIGGGDAANMGGKPGNGIAVQPATKAAFRDYLTKAGLDGVGNQGDDPMVWATHWHNTIEGLAKDGRENPDVELLKWMLASGQFGDGSEAGRQQTRAAFEKLYGSWNDTSPLIPGGEPNPARAPGRIAERARKAIGTVFPALAAKAETAAGVADQLGGAAVNRLTQPPAAAGAGGVPGGAPGARAAAPVSQNQLQKTGGLVRADGSGFQPDGSYVDEFGNRSGGPAAPTTQPTAGAPAGGGTGMAGDQTRTGYTGTAGGTANDPGVDALADFVNDPYNDGEIGWNMMLNTFKSSKASGVFMQWLERQQGRYFGEYLGSLGQEAASGRVPIMSFTQFLQGKTGAQVGVAESGSRGAAAYAASLPKPAAKTAAPSATASAGGAAPVGPLPASSPAVSPSAGQTAGLTPNNVGAQPDPLEELLGIR